MVDIHRDSAGSLGLSIAGGRGSPMGDIPIIVASLTPGGPADLSSKIQVRGSLTMIQILAPSTLNVSFLQIQVCGFTHVQQAGHT